MCIEIHTCQRLWYVLTAEFLLIVFPIEAILRCLKWDIKPLLYCIGFSWIFNECRKRLLRSVISAYINIGECTRTQHKDGWFPSYFSTAVRFCQIFFLLSLDSIYSTSIYEQKEVFFFPLLNTSSFILTPVLLLKREYFICWLFAPLYTVQKAVQIVVVLYLLILSFKENVL